MGSLKVRELLTSKKFITSCSALVAAAIIGTVAFDRPKLDWPEIIDPPLEVTLEAEDTPLSSEPTVTTKTTKKTKSSKKTVKLKKKSKKTYTKNLGTKTKKNTKTVKNGNSTIKTDTTIATTTTEKYKKNSKKKTVITKVTTTTTVTTTVQPVVVASQESASSSGQTASATANSSTATTVANASTEDTSAANLSTTAETTATDTLDASTSSGPTEIAVRSIAPLMDNRVLTAFETLGFKVIVNPSVNYAGYFNAKDRSITLKKADNTIYHELGHFAAFIAGNVDKSSAFATVYAQEKDSFPGANKVYASQNASEYFGESMRVYILQKSELKAACPNTAAAIEAAIEKITDAQITLIQKVYGSAWS